MNIIKRCVNWIVDFFSGPTSDSFPEDSEQRFIDRLQSVNEAEQIRTQRILNEWRSLVNSSPRMILANTGLHDRSISEQMNAINPSLPIITVQQNDSTGSNHITINRNMIRSSMETYREPQSLTIDDIYNSIRIIRNANNYQITLNPIAVPQVPQVKEEPNKGLSTYQQSLENEKNSVHTSLESDSIVL